jgi:hypothetical protein
MQSTGELVADTTRDTAELVKNEVRLLAAEARDSLKQFSLAAALAGTALVLSFIAGIMIAIALAELPFWSDEVLAWARYALTGLLLFLVAGALCATAWMRFKKIEPLAGFDRVKSDARWLKNELRSKTS